MPDKILSLRIPDEILKWLNDASEVSGLPVSVITRNLLIADYTSRQKRLLDIKPPQDPATKNKPPKRERGGKISKAQKEAPVPKVGRNDPCSCGSGKKYKKCHGLNSN